MSILNEKRCFACKFKLKTHQVNQIFKANKILTLNKKYFIDRGGLDLSHII